MAKGNIPFIHNYCDRWCERCTFTSRCSVFESESETAPEQRDIKNKAFWERLSQNFSKAKDALEEAAKRQGLNVEGLKNDISAAENKMKEKKKEMNDHPVIKMAGEYTQFSHQWLQTQPGMLEKLEKLKENLTLGTQSEKEAKDLTVMIKDSLAVIQWYSTLIQPKLMRALSGKIDEALWDFDDDDQRDYDGSAKIAIISIERSMQAWSNLFEFLAEQEDDFLKALSLLERMKSATLKEFPNAMNFVRPGFDENLG